MKRNLFGTGVLGLALGLTAMCGMGASSALVADTTVTVTVTDPAGAPVDGIEVQLQKIVLSTGGQGPSADPGKSSPGGARAALPGPQTLQKKNTEKDGRVVFTGVPAGRARVFVAGNDKFRQKFVQLKVAADKDNPVMMKLDAK